MINEQKIKAQNSLGQTIEFDFNEILAYWVDYYASNNMSQLANYLPRFISITAEQEALIKEKAAKGFRKFILLPSIEVQKENIHKIKAETEKEVEGLAVGKQFSPSGAFFWADVQAGFPNNITTLNRPVGKPYLLFIKDEREVPVYTLNSSAEEAKIILQESNETGLTLVEYLILQREHVRMNINNDKPHMDTDYYTWLLDSEIKEKGYLKAHWHSVYKQVRINVNQIDGKSEYRGFRSSVVITL